MSAFGIDTEFGRCEYLGYKYGKRLEIEQGLFRTKWFDYRFLHPVQATYQYAQDFEEVYRDIFKTNIDSAAAEYIKVFKREDIFDVETRPSDHVLSKFIQKREINLITARKTTLTGLWNGRQVADCIGMPYPLFVRSTMQESLRYWNQPRLPKPSQLYAERVIERVVDIWEKRQEAMLIKAEHPMYLNENYTGVWFQDSHHEWLIDQAYKRGNPLSTLAQLTFSENLLPEDKIRNRLNPEDFATMKSYA